MDEWEMGIEDEVDTVSHTWHPICQGTNSYIYEKWNEKSFLFIFIIKWYIKEEVSNQWAFLFHFEKNILFYKLTVVV